MFNEIAEHYDYFKQHRDYTLEAATIDDLLKQYGGPATRSVVELGCGTGSLLEELATYDYEVTGVDSSSAMLDRARKKLGENTPLIESDFTSYKPSSKHDAVLWIDGAIGYVSDKELPDTLKNISQNILAQSGVVVIEPWYSPETWEPDTNHLVTHTTETGEIYVRMSHGSADGSVDFHHLIADQNGIQHLVGNTKFWLHNNDQVCEVLAESGLEVKQVASADPFKRGLIVGSRIV